MVHPDLLQRIDLFWELSETELESLSQSAMIRHYRGGEIISSAATLDRDFRLVLSGRVKLSRTSPEGREQILFIFGPGEPFCLASSFQQQPLPGTVTALEESGILAVPGPALEVMVRAHPSLLFNIMGVMARRLKNAMQLIETLALKDVPQRVAAFLVHSSTMDCSRGDRETFELCITQREMAKSLGTTPETLSRSIRKLEQEGLLEAAGRTIRILDRDGLQRLAAS
ncbi:MAG: Crp/Fnr family transcriptional regulator [Desulfohalobiaceae bacterium]